MSARAGRERQEWSTMVAGAECFRKNNIRLFGDIRLLRFKIGKARNCPLPFHRRESPIRTLRIGRVAFAVVRQEGELEAEQIPVVSDRNALVRTRLALARIVDAPRLFIAGLFVRRRKYSHFLMLGYNCEMAYRYVKFNGFLDSTFFAWAGGLGCEKMLAALERFDELFTGDMTLATRTRDVFADAGTGVLMHSHYSEAGFGADDRMSADIESVKAEIRSRAAYLREKFYRQLRDDEPTLVPIKMKHDDCPCGDAYVHRFIDWLKARGGRNFDVLVICQKNDAACFPPEHPGYFLRTVSSYTPDWFAATEQFGDRYGWNLIWTEFASAKKLEGKKKFKFDAERRHG